MKYQSNASKRRRARVKRILGLESLEGRTLLTAGSETFTGPSLADLIALAEKGTDTAPAAINRELSALETQLTQGPLADLTSGTVDSSGFVQEVQDMDQSYEQDLGRVLAAFPNVNEILDLGGQAVVADSVALNQEYSVGLLSSSDLATYAQSAIDSLTAAPIDSLNLALSTYASETEGFESDLNTLVASLSASATPSLTPSEVSATVLTEADAFIANISAGLQVTHPNIEKTVENAVNNLEATATELAGESSSDAASALSGAIAALDAALLDTTGEFGPKGPISEAISGHATIAPVRTNAQASTVVSAVSGLAMAGGTATLTATLNASSGRALGGETVDFTLDGVFAGAAVTNSSGVATLSGVTTTDSPGNDSTGVVASFVGTSKYRPSDASGDLLVTQVGTVLTSVAGTASYGGTATLTATLLNPVADVGVAGETVDFTLDGTSVGLAVTDNSGVATLTGVATTEAVGTDTGGVVASFAGDANYAAPAANGTGNLVVSQAATTLGDVAGTATSGSTATLTATLTSAVANLPISGEEVSFTLDGTSVGSAETDSDGIATLSGVSTSDAIGTDTDGVVASFAGDGVNYAAAANATGNLVVSSTATVGTTLGSVSGTAAFGGSATLTATLTDTATSAGVAGETIDFTLDGTPVGTATTDSNGVATLTGVATTDGLGTDSGGVVATFAGDTTYINSTGTGDLVVSQAGTTLSAAGTATYGTGTATLTATLTSAATGAGIAGETIDFTLDGVTLTSAVTNSDGVATLTDVSTSDGLGTDTDGVVASFAGDTDYISSTATGNLVVRQATTLGSVSGTAAYGGTATLTATLTDSADSTDISGETIDFTLDGKSVGSAVTDSNGVAMLSDLSTTDGLGTDSGGVVASFGGDDTYSASTGTGDLVVTQAGTSITNVAGTSTAGSGTATLTATLLSAATNAGVAGEPVDFTLDNVSVGYAVTNSDGIATLTDAPTSDGPGTDTGGVVASFAGDTDYTAAANATGNLVVTQGTTLGSVSAGATYGGTATLTATLTLTSSSAGIVGETVDFTLDGVVVGSAVTDSNGAATLSGIATTDAAGTDSSGVVASFAGDSNYSAASGTGDLDVSQAGTTLGSVSGTDAYGGTATLTATLTSSVTGAGVAGETVDFTLDGNSVGSATTNSDGVATLTGVTTSDAVGTQNNDIVASFTGDSNYVAATNATGDLVVSQADTTVSAVSGTASYGGSATLTATLISSATAAGVAGETVDFTLDGLSVGSSTTDSDGVATLTGVTTNDAAATDTNGIVASFAGDNANYAAAPSVTGNLVVSPAATALVSVSGTASAGTATLTATLTSSVTGAGVGNETIDFTLDGTSVGTATTDSDGVATLAGIATSDAVGTDEGGVSVSFIGQTDYEASTGTGDLEVTTS